MLTNNSFGTNTVFVLDDGALVVSKEDKDGGTVMQRQDRKGTAITER